MPKINSTSLNTAGGQDPYGESKAALDHRVRCYAARQIDGGRTLLLVNPGHVQTDLGGPGAPLTVDESIPAVVTTVLGRAGQRGSDFVDRFDAEVPSEAGSKRGLDDCAESGQANPDSDSEFGQGDCCTSR